MHQVQTAELARCASEFSAKRGACLSEEVERSAALLLCWVDYLVAYHKTGVADSLLEALRSLIRETAGVLSLGLVRPALFSLRGQIDLLLAWLYFRDHRVEWETVNATGDGFKMKRDVIQYLDQHIAGFTARNSLLRDIRTRSHVDPYRLLSAHIHAQNESVIPRVVDLKDLVRGEEECSECAAVAFEVAEYLSDVLLAVFAPSWASLPEAVQSAMSGRFKTANQRKAFFE